jgi:regulator of sigma E protease
MSLFTIILFLLLLGVLIFVHELGHFLTAIKNGIKAEEFGFGFPPRMLGVAKEKSSGRWRVVFGGRDIESDGTVYSVNWIPFGGFVRMKGEDENALDEPDSFAAKPAGIRVLVLAAGVIMNFALAWVLITSLYVMGVPQAVTDENRSQAEETFVQILGVVSGSPAESMGLQPGDRVKAVDGIAVSTTESLSNLVSDRQGNSIELDILRGDRSEVLRGTPRMEIPEGEGALGISFSEIGIFSYPWYQAPLLGAQATWYATGSILSALGTIVGQLILGHGGDGADLTGPVGIVYLTKQMSELGVAYLLQFAAILSINLAIFKILPFPGLDGGRILFVLIEKLKGSPVREIVEQRFHQIGFLLLLVLMLAVTLRDVAKFEVLEKIGSLFTRF